MGLCEQTRKKGKLSALCHSAKRKQTSAAMNQGNILGFVALKQSKTKFNVKANFF